MSAVVMVLRPKLRPEDVARICKMAPPRPPCFESDEAWHEYLIWCEASEEPGHTPTVSGAAEPGEPARRRLFNNELPFCRDCDMGAFKRRMRLAGKCRPDWLKAREWDTSAVPLLEAAGCA